jgi:ferrous iron transport protein A
MTLKEAKAGMTVKVVSLEHSDLKQRLMSLGLIKGTVIKVLRSAPLGDPMAISLRAYNLSLRLADADKIKVEVV